MERITCEQMADACNCSTYRIKEIIGCMDWDEDLKLVLLGEADDGRYDPCWVALYDTPLGYISVWDNGDTELLLEDRKQVRRDAMLLGGYNAWCKNQLISRLHKEGYDICDLLTLELVNIEDIEAVKDSGREDYAIIRRDCIYIRDEWRFAEYEDDCDKPVTHNFTDTVRQAEELNRAAHDQDMYKLESDETIAPDFFVVEL